MFQCDDQAIYNKNKQKEERAQVARIPTVGLARMISLVMGEGERISGPDSAPHPHYRFG
jgi:hypothetical protein